MKTKVSNFAVAAALILGLVAARAHEWRADGSPASLLTAPSAEPLPPALDTPPAANGLLIAGSITQGRGSTTTTNLFPPGQRVTAVGTITATDASVWTVPAATLFATAPKAPDLYNQYNAVTPANLAARQAAIDALPVTVVDNDGEVVTGYIFADNYFELYVNGTLEAIPKPPS